MPDYFTLAELRALPKMGDAAKYPEARIEAAAAYIVGIIERETETAFVSRTITGEAHPGGRSAVVLDKAHATAVTSLTVDGVAVTVGDLTLESGVVRYTNGGDFASGTVLVTYTYGYSTAPPADIKEAALKGTRAHLLATDSNSVDDDRRTSINTEGGTVSFVVAGRDHPTGYPEVDATILAWRDRLDGDGFA